MPQPAGISKLFQLAPFGMAFLEYITIRIDMLEHLSIIEILTDSGRGF